MTIHNSINKADYAKAIGDVVTKCRRASFKAKLDPKEQMKVVAVWIEIFEFERIPIDAIDLCYLAAQGAAMAMQNDTGRRPIMDAVFVAAQWRGAIKDDYFKKRANRSLTTSKVHGCPDCFGTGRVHKQIDGRLQLTAEICTHLNYSEEKQND
jgi:hypothetical protein